MEADQNKKTIRKQFDRARLSPSTNRLWVVTMHCSQFQMLAQGVDLPITCMVECNHLQRSLIVMAEACKGCQDVLGCHDKQIM